VEWSDAPPAIFWVQFQLFDAGRSARLTWRIYRLRWLMSFAHFSCRLVVLVKKSQPPFSSFLHTNTIETDFHFVSFVHHVDLTILQLIFLSYDYETIFGRNGVVSSLLLSINN
jgi:hypothetical protein